MIFQAAFFIEFPPSPQDREPAAGAGQLCGRADRLRAALAVAADGAREDQAVGEGGQSKCVCLALLPELHDWVECVGEMGPNLIFVSWFSEICFCCC